MIFGCRPMTDSFFMFVQQVCFKISAYFRIVPFSPLNVSVRVPKFRDVESYFSHGQRDIVVFVDFLDVGHSIVGFFSHFLGDPH